MTDSIDRQRLIRDEYKYRHEHIWATIFKLTFSAVLISVVPYLHREVACVLGIESCCCLSLRSPCAFLGICVCAGNCVFSTR